MITHLLGLDTFTYCVVTIGLWLAFGFASFLFFSSTLATFTNYEKTSQKVEFVLYWTGLVHAIVATYASYYCYYFTCDGW